MAGPTNPDTTEHSIVDALPATVQAAAGGALERVRDAARAARIACRLLTAEDPWSGGTASRARRVARSLEAMYDGLDSRLARATREQRTPWFLDEDPLKSALTRTMILVGEATELARVVHEVRILCKRSRALEIKVAADVPSAWDRLFTRRGLHAGGIDAIMTFEELEVVRRSLQRSLRALVAWRGDLRRWITQEIRASAREDLGRGQVATAGHAGLEARYELLLRLGAIDRAPLQRRCADTIRSAVRRHVEILAGDARVSVDDPLYRLVSDYASAYQDSAMIPRDEAEAYRAGIARFQRRAIGADARG